jgi:hypothetical protein
MTSGETKPPFALARQSGRGEGRSHPSPNGPRIKRRLLFVSNLFPDSHEPCRGLNNVTVLHHLRQQWDIRVLSPRPSLTKGWLGSPATLHLASRQCITRTVQAVAC